MLLKGKIHHKRDSKVVETLVQSLDICAVRLEFRYKCNLIYKNRKGYLRKYANLQLFHCARSSTPIATSSRCWALFFKPTMFLPCFHLLNYSLLLSSSSVLPGTCKSRVASLMSRDCQAVEFVQRSMQLQKKKDISVFL